MFRMGIITPSRARIKAIGNERDVDGSFDDVAFMGFGCERLLTIYQKILNIAINIKQR